MPILVCCAVHLAADNTGLSCRHSRASSLVLPFTSFCFGPLQAFLLLHHSRWDVAVSSFACSVFVAVGFSGIAVGPAVTLASKACSFPVFWLVSSPSSSLQDTQHRQYRNGQTTILSILQDTRQYRKTRHPQYCKTQQPRQCGETHDNIVNTARHTTTAEIA